MHFGIVGRKVGMREENLLIFLLGVPRLDIVELFLYIHKNRIRNAIVRA